jgi:hypothetical protein
MIKQIISPSIGVVLILGFGFLTFLEPQTTEAIEWWKPFKYEKWNCCPRFNPNSNFKPIPNLESISSNEIIQNIEVNQGCDHIQICLINLHDLNSQVNYSDR